MKRKRYFIEAKKGSEQDIKDFVTLQDAKSIYEHLLMSSLDHILLKETNVDLDGNILDEKPLAEFTNGNFIVNELELETPGDPAVMNFEDELKAIMGDISEIDLVSLFNERELSYEEKLQLHDLIVKYWENIHQLDVVDVMSEIVALLKPEEVIQPSIEVTLEESFERFVNKTDGELEGDEFERALAVMLDTLETSGYINTEDIAKMEVYADHMVITSINPDFKSGAYQLIGGELVDYNPNDINLEEDVTPQLWDKANDELEKNQKAKDEAQKVTIAESEEVTRGQKAGEKRGPYKKDLYRTLSVRLWDNGKGYEPYSTEDATGMFVQANSSEELQKAIDLFNELGVAYRLGYKNGFHRITVDLPETERERVFESIDVTEVENKNGTWTYSAICDGRRKKIISYDKLSKKAAKEKLLKEDYDKGHTYNIKDKKQITVLSPYDNANYFWAKYAYEVPNGHLWNIINPENKIEKQITARTVDYVISELEKLNSNIKPLIANESLLTENKRSILKQAREDAEMFYEGGHWPEYIPELEEENIEEIMNELDYNREQAIIYRNEIIRLYDNKDFLEESLLTENTNIVKNFLQNLVTPEGQVRSLRKDEKLPRKFRFKSGTNNSGEVTYDGKDYAYAVVKGELRVMPSSQAGTNWSETIYKESLDTYKNILNKLEIVEKNNKFDDYLDAVTYMDELNDIIKAKNLAYIAKAIVVEKNDQDLPYEVTFEVNDAFNESYTKKEYEAFINGTKLNKGDIIKSFRDEEYEYLGTYHPRKLTAREVGEDSFGIEYYPGVFEAEIREVDQLTEARYNRYIVTVGDSPRDEEDVYQTHDLGKAAKVAKQWLAARAYSYIYDMQEQRELEEDEWENYLEESFKVVDKQGKKVPQGGGFTSRKEAESFASQYGEKDLKVVKEDFEDEHLGGKSVLTEGTWELPNTEAKANILKQLFEKEIGYDEALSILGDIWGDDELYDDLEEHKDSEDIRWVIANHLGDLIQYYETSPEDFRLSFDPETLSILKEIVSKETKTVEDYKFTGQGLTEIEQSHIYENLLQYHTDLESWTTINKDGVDLIKAVLTNGSELEYILIDNELYPA